MIMWIDFLSLVLPPDLFNRFCFVLLVPNRRESRDLKLFIHSS